MVKTGLSTRLTLGVLVVAALFTSCSHLQPTIDLTQPDLSRDPAANGPVAQVDWRAVFAELFARNIRANAPNAAAFEQVATRSLYYSEAGFQRAYNEILNSRSSDEAFMKRERLMTMTNAKLGTLLQATHLKAATLQPARPLIETVLNSTENTATKNFFETARGQAVALALKDYAFLVLPGFGSHTIADFTWPEIVRAANAYHGRELVRKGPDKADPKLKTGYIEYYSKGSDGFDVLHPMGYELGFSMGSDLDSAEALAAWLAGIRSIPRFANKKFVILGYSKGTPIAHNLVTNFPEIGQHVAAIITMAGVAQGAVPAESGIRKVMSALKVKSHEDLVEGVERSARFAELAANTLAPVFVGVAMSHQATDGFAKPVNAIAHEALKQVAGAADNAQAIEGIVDMTQFQRSKWNLINMNDDRFTKKISIFNISAVSNVKDFILPTAPVSNRPITAPTTVPQISTKGIDNRLFSRDNVFLYMTSISGFKESPGGLFDTQVAWLDTKSMALDSRPLKDSLAPEQIAQFRDELASDGGIRLPAGFENVPRNQVLASIARGKNQNISYVDLGELRGTHWDIAFEQVYKPLAPGTTDFVHKFPRIALQESILEMLAIYQSVGGLQ